MTGGLYTKYFAYGSNMLPEQMDFRCPGANPVGVATLKGWKFIINDRGVATIKKDSGSSVIGVIWDIRPDHESILDSYEGVADKCYFKEFVDVDTVDGEKINCLVYIDPETDPGPPRNGYLDKIIRGARQFEIPDDYIAMLESWSG